MRLGALENAVRVRYELEIIIAMKLRASYPLIQKGKN